MKQFLFVFIFLFVLLLTDKNFAQNKPLINITCDSDNESSESVNYDLKFNNITYDLGRKGNEKSSIRFNGQESFIQGNVNVNPSVIPKLTVVFWAKPDFDNKTMTIFSHDDGGFDRSIAIDSRSGGGFKWTAYFGSPIGSTKINIDKWTFVAASFNNLKKEILICVDGKFYKKTGDSGPGLNYFHFGDNPSFGEPYFGLLDDINIYDKALSKEDLLDLFKSQGGKINNSDQYFYSIKSELADVVVRVGDIDDMGFNYAKGFDPFCGKNTTVHGFPWETDENDHFGTDRIMVVSSYKSGRSDGYASSTKRPDNKPVAIIMQYKNPTVKIEKIILQMMLDDFQAPVWGTSFQFQINGKRLTYVEDIINQLSQTGPTGKLVQIGLLPEDNYLFEEGKVSIKIDDPITGSGDGFAIDFVQILINPKGEYNCIGNIRGIVKDVNGKPLDDVLISANGIKEYLTKNNGSFDLTNVPIGIITVSANKEMFSQTNVSFELKQNESKEIEIILKKKTLESENYLRKELNTKGFVNLYGIHFDSGKAIPKSESLETLEELANFLNKNASVNIEIVGHTDSDGDKNSNKDLSERRARSVISWLKDNGVNIDHIKAKGLGESSPISSNTTESGKALNRRVEIRVSR